jgi:alanine racemase
MAAGGAADGSGGIAGQTAARVRVSDPAARAGAHLTVDLDAIAANYRILCAETGDTACGAVVKADAYGLGVDRVAPVLARVGARDFFVATIDEALDLREILDAAAVPEARIAVLNGPLPGTEPDLVGFGITPVLNSLDDLARWGAAARARGLRLPAILHVDTGMSRLGLPDSELAVLHADPERLAPVALRAVMSHLACAPDPEHPENAAQLARLRAALAHLPAAPVSLANSSGIFLGPAYRFDLARPGVALYGVNPAPYRDNPMYPVVRLCARVLQVRQIDAPRGVGYGSTFRAAGPTRIATVAAGYGDGVLRALSNSGCVVAGGQRLPIVGRVSMDSITIDATALPPDTLKAGDCVTLIGPDHDVDALAAEAGTIGYEILTALGRRYHRTYRGGDG